MRDQYLCWQIPLWKLYKKCTRYLERKKAHQEKRYGILKGKKMLNSEKVPRSFITFHPCALVTFVSYESASLSLALFPLNSVRTVAVVRREEFP